MSFARTHILSREKNKIVWYTVNLMYTMQPFKVALYSFFGARGIGTNGTSARVFKKDFYFDDVTENKSF